MSHISHSSNVKPRSSNFELLRLIAIGLIVFSHLARHGFYSPTTHTLLVENVGNRVLLKSLFAGSLGVDLFVMISGYFLINAKEVAGNKALQLAAKTWLYSMLGFVLFSQTPFNLSEGVRFAMPITHGVYWFVTVYLITFLLCPYYNRILNPSTSDTLCHRRNMQHIILLCSAFFVLPYTFLKTPCFASEVPIFFLLYAIGGYLRLYRDTHSTKTYVYGFVVCALLWLIIPSVSELSGIERLKTLNSYFYTTNSLLTVVLSACTVALVSKWNIHSKWINRLATFAFPVYIISEHPLVRDELYQHFFRLNAIGESPILGIYLLCYAVAIFTACILIDCLRRYVLMELLNRVFPKTKVRLYKWADRVTAQLYT